MKKIIFVVLCSFMMCGCMSTHHTKSTLGSTPATTLEAQIQRLREASDIADGSATKIKTTAQDIQKQTEKPENVTPEIINDISKKSQDIENNADSIKNEIKRIQDTNNDIQNKIVPVIVDTENKLTKTQDDLKKAEENKKQQERLYTILAGIFGLGSVAIIAGIVYSFFNGRIGLLIAGGGLLVTLVAAAGTYYLKQLAIVGLVLVALLLLVTIVILAKSFWQARIRSDALENIVHINENIKEDIPENIKVKWYGDGNGTKGLVSDRMTEKQKEEIRKIREKLSQNIKGEDIKDEDSGKNE